MFKIIIKSVIILTVFFAFLSIYLRKNFKYNLKNTQAELFQSHEPSDLSKEVFPYEITQKAQYLHFQLIKKCQDVQINKDGQIYCGTFDQGMIIKIDPQNKKTQMLAQLKGQNIYGLRLSRDQKILYFISSKSGLTQIQLETNKITSLVSYFDGKFLLSLNSIQTHPQDPNVLFFDQSMSQIPMYDHHIEIMLNQANGRLFKHLIKQNKTQLITTGLHFANGVVFQKYKGQQTILVAQTNRFNIIRVYVAGPKKGQKMVAAQLDIFLDNMKQNENGQIWVAGPSKRDRILYNLDYMPKIRTIISKFPSQFLQIARDKSILGGAKITFDEQNNFKKVDYYLWKSPKKFDYSFITAINERNNKLFISSLKYQGIFMINNVTQLQNQKRSYNNNQKNYKNKQEL